MARSVCGVAPMRIGVRAAAAAALIFVLASCDWFDDPSPDQARLLIDGPTGTAVKLLTSTKFVAARRNDGVTAVEIVEADTTSVTLPFEASYNIRDDQRFLAWTSYLGTSIETMRMRVFLDGAKEFDEAGRLDEGIDYRFLYAFNQPVTDVIEITF